MTDIRNEITAALHPAVSDLNEKASVEVKSYVGHILLAGHPFFRYRPDDIYTTLRDSITRSIEPGK